MTRLRIASNFALGLFLALPVLGQQTAPVPRGVFTGSTDIGHTRAGSTIYDATTATYRVTGGGADMWGAADDFHFTWVKLSGDAALAADIRFTGDAIVPLQKAVLIFRQSLDPDSAYADIAIHGDGHITLQYRAVAGAKTEDITAAKTSRRLRIERKGNRFTASVVGEGGALTPFAFYTVPMAGSVYVGIGVCAHNANGLASATFSHVKREPDADRH